MERAFYAQRIKELQAVEAGLERDLKTKDDDVVRRQYRESSRRVLDQAIRQRYERRKSAWFDADKRRVRCYTRDLLAEYPVVLTTCHLIRQNLGEGTLLDWLIIDEATQTGLLEAGLAMSRARRVVIVGDLRQLGHIMDVSIRDRLPSPPVPAYEVVEHSVLSSVKMLYGQSLAQTMLREHYRCAPAIIEFCNQMFYDGELIPVRHGLAEDTFPPLLVRKTVPGHHARRITRGKQRGTYNQREIDEVEDLLAGMLAEAGIDGDVNRRGQGGDYELGVTTPYRLQADRLGAVLSSAPEGVPERWLAETVHKFQGRGARIMVFSTVLDDSWRSRLQLRFVDDPRIINVAVSRAKERFVLVTHHAEAPTSTVIKALIDYIRYQDPDQIKNSDVTSVFDLLYAEYSERLKRFAGRIYGHSRYLSENALETLLRDILTEPRYKHLAVVPQVRLRDLLPDTYRLDDRQNHFVRSVSAVDFAIYDKVSRKLLLTIEVNGTAYHENNPEQEMRDEIKYAILTAYSIPLLVLPTNGSREWKRICEKLDEVI